MKGDTPCSLWTLQYNGAQKHTLQSRGKMEGNYEETALFGFVIKGQIAAVVHNDHQGAVRKLLSGEVFYLAPYSRFTLHNPLEEPVDLLLIHFHMYRVQANHPSPSAVSLLPGAEQGKLYKCPFPQMHHWLEDFLDTGREQEAAHYYWLHSHLYAITSTLLKYYQHPQAEEGDLEGYVRQIRQSIIDNFDKDLDIEQTARLSGVSPNRFYQAFKQATGLSPHKFMTFIRLNVSLSLLASSPASIMSVAHSIGYTDELYFSRLFKKHMGLTPSEYAQASQQTVAVLSAVFQGDLQVIGLKSRLVQLADSKTEGAKGSYIEQLVQMDPDLVLAPRGQHRDQEWARTLKILELDDRDPDWKSRLKLIGEQLGIPGVASRWLTHYEGRAVIVRKLVRKWFSEEPFVIIQAGSEHYRLFGCKHYRVQQCFYGDLELRPSEAVQQLDYRDIDSLNDLKELQNEHLIVLVHSSASQRFRKEVEAQWRTRGNNSRGRVCVVLDYTNDDLHDAFTYGSLVESFLEQLISGKYGG
ncbi:AraC family transcriptional regulator [Paenibacillus senegalensis]|uniref:AraC family transcriptional regulator n=1 Tax=Paenibacillus senegalensis TaxID=1465766 RepID=UPI0002895932|nr:AraC family transcriptional regulator [Paenibacillus senegalensis]